MNSPGAGGPVDRQPYDPLKPKLPYQRGLQIRVRRHVPPPPFGRGYQHPWRHQAKRSDELSGIIPSEYCFQNPPPPTTPHADSSVHTLTIVKEIATRDGRGPQVVCCQLDQQPDYLVAKIFDPLYYSWYDPDLACSSDVVCSADREYSCEAAAYEQIQLDGIDGKYLPRYYGSWTFEMCLAGRPEKKREVRMVLIEYIPGSSMHSILASGQTDKFSPDARLDILAKAMEMFCWLLYHGISQGDFAPRNIMISTEQRVTLIDLSQAYVPGLPNSTTPFRDDRKRPVNPAAMFHPFSREFDCWIPANYRLHDSFHQWKVTRWENSEEFDPCPDWVKHPEKASGDSPSP